jgi:signal transduction histidine kinase
VTAKQQGQAVAFFFTDNGIGIEPEYRERVFGLFNTIAFKR